MFDFWAARQIRDTGGLNRCTAGKQPSMGHSKPPTTLIVTRTSETKLSDARRWLRQQTDLNDLCCELVLTELITNALEHGAGGTVRVHATLSSDALDVEVTNTVDPDLVMPSFDAPLPGPDQGRGRGLHLIRHLADVDQRNTDGLLSVHARVPIGH